MLASLSEFIDRSPSSFHTIASIEAELINSNYKRLYENEKWNLIKGGKYYVVRNSSSLIAFVPGVGNRFNIVASHSDSPCFKVKPDGEIKTEEYTKLNVEKYGSMNYSSWLDRPLTLAGRVMVETDDGIEERLINFGRDMVLIPSVAIHLNRDLNNGVKLSVQNDLCPLLSADGNIVRISELIADEIGVPDDKILAYELSVANNEKSRIWGENKEFISAPRLDDLQCVYSSLAGFLNGKSDSTNVYCCFDNEEVGSGTRQGAESTFLSDILKRINISLGRTEEDLLIAIDNSFMISADNAHAVHPNHTEKTDVNNKCYPNGGVVIKLNSSQKYMSDAYSIAKAKSICSKGSIPFQVFVNNSDIAGGSTLGNISTRHVSVKGVDVGAAQFAMHSAFETAGNLDTEFLTQFFSMFFKE